MTNDNVVRCLFCNKDDSEDIGNPIWVGCECCDTWAHLTCIPLQYIVPKVERRDLLFSVKEKHVAYFKCPLHSNCKGPILKLKGFPAAGTPVSSKLPKRSGLRRKRAIDYVALDEGSDKRLKHEHPHKEAFLSCFERWKGLDTISSEELVANFQSITKPLKIRDPENSGMHVVSANELGFVQSKNRVSMNVEFLTRVMGQDYPLDVMDVQTQMNEKWTLGQWNEYFTYTYPNNRDRIKNVISLEVSHVEEFAEQIRRPTAVAENDLVDIVWNLEDGNPEMERPKVTKYILMSVANAYTDFHLDFAGTSVYYNLVSGSKKFILFPPTTSNLRRYTEWCRDDNQNLIFLGDQLEDGIAMELTAGDVFMIPCGYIHAVYTPEDSFIVGGNFLTLRDLATQLKVVDIEQQTGVTKKFTFPNFEAVMGRAGEWLLETGNLKSVTPKNLESLIAYLSSSKIKYKPLKHQTKRALISRLQDALATVK